MWYSFAIRDVDRRLDDLTSLYTRIEANMTSRVMSYGPEFLERMVGAMSARVLRRGLMENLGCLRESCVNVLPGLDQFRWLRAVFRWGAIDRRFWRGFADPLHCPRE